MAASSPPPITIFGRTTCEDTAIVRDRLRALGVPFQDVDLDRDAGAARLVETLNDGSQVTPTVLFGSTDSVLSEPTLDTLDKRLADDGWPLRKPGHMDFGDTAVAGPLPGGTLVNATGEAFPLTGRDDRGQRGLAIFFAHAADCRACSGYARQLAAVRQNFADGDVRALVVVPGGPADAAHWLSESTDKVPIAADAGGRWKTAIEGHIGADGRGGAIVLAVDRHLVPRIGSTATDAGGLATPLELALLVSWT